LGRFPEREKPLSLRHNHTGNLERADYARVTVSDDPIQQPPEELPDPREVRTAPYRGVDFTITLKWLGAGTLLYAMLLLVAMRGNPADATLPIIGPSLYLTPMFGLPYVLATLDMPGRTRRILYFLILLPLAHVAANYVAWRYAVYNFDPMDVDGDLHLDLVTGALGGFTGSVLALALLKTVRLGAPHRSNLIGKIVAVILLTAVGAGGMAAGLLWTNALHDPKVSHQIIWYETVHFPWQLAFALLLAAIMHKPRPAREVRTGPGKNSEATDGSATG
jgi:hypothetical protein